MKVDADSMVPRDVPDFVPLFAVWQALKYELKTSGGRTPKNRLTTMKAMDEEPIDVDFIENIHNKKTTRELYESIFVPY